MKRNFNYTGRTKIKRESATLRLKKSENQPLSCDIDLKLESYGFPANAELYLEVYNKYEYKRLSLGPVGSFKPDSKKVGAFTSEDVLRFRIKVVDETQSHGLILAALDGIATKDPLPPNSILFFRPDDLGDIVYDVECSTHEEPILLVNNRLQSIDIREMAQTNPVFLALAFPSVVKDILLQILFTDRIYETGDDAWQNRWLYYIVNICGAPLPPEIDEEETGKILNDDELSEWVDTAIQAFCRQNHFFESFEHTYREAMESD
jgi:hypothetical protein